MRRETSAQPPQTAALAPPGSGRSAIEEAVSTAYQVFDRYLEEGRQFAQGQSAWYGNAEGQPELTRDAARTFADFLGILGRLARELQSSTSAFPAEYAQPSSRQPVPTSPGPSARQPISSLDEHESTEGGAAAGGRAPGPLVQAPATMHVAPVGSSPEPLPATPSSLPPAAPTEPQSAPIRTLGPTTVPVGEVKTLAQPSPAATALAPRSAAVARAPVTVPLNEWVEVASSLTPPDPRDEPRWPGGVKRPSR